MHMPISCELHTSIYVWHTHRCLEKESMAKQCLLIAVGVDGVGDDTHLGRDRVQESVRTGVAAGCVRDARVSHFLFLFCGQ